MSIAEESVDGLRLVSPILARLARQLEIVNELLLLYEHDCLNENEISGSRGITGQTAQGMDAAMQTIGDAARLLRAISQELPKGLAAAEAALLSAAHLEATQHIVLGECLDINPDADATSKPEKFEIF